MLHSFGKSKSDCVLFVWNSDDPYDLSRATEQASLEDVDFGKIIDELKNNLDYSVLGDFDLKSIELENGFTISVVKYVTMNNLKKPKKSIKEEYDPTDNIVNKGNSVSMDYETFIKFTDGLGIRFNTKEAKIVYLSNDIEMKFGDSVLVLPKDDILDIVVNAHSSMEIKTKFIDKVASVSLKNDVLRADFFTKEGNVLTVWWEV